MNNSFILFIILYVFLNQNKVLAQNIATFGKEMPIIKEMNIGPSSDAAIIDNILCVVGSGSIYVFDISEARNPVLLDSLNNLGNVRQVEIENGYAFVTAREEGLYIINIEDPSNILLVSHYDTLELGTGIAVSGSVAAVANRQYGVELIDVSNKREPRFLGAIRTGEAQSVFLKDTFLFVGNWGEQSISICNISDPSKPKIISEIPLDGFGDGVFVKGNLCFAATGHHARGYKKYLDETDPAFGKGHGLQIIDISNPYFPKMLSILKLPTQFQRHLDMWDVQVSGDFAFVGDSESGLFIVNIKDPINPFFIGHKKFPMTIFQENEIAAPVGGFALGEGCIYIAGKITDLYLLEALELSKKIENEATLFDGDIQLKTDRKVSQSNYSPEGQVHSAFLHTETNNIFLAAGYGGVHKVTLSPNLEGKEILNTGNVIFDVAILGNNLFLAEGIAGFSIWQYKDELKPKFLGRYKPKKGGVYQLLINPNMKNAVLHVGTSKVDIVDFSNPIQIESIREFEMKAPLYRLPISYGLLEDSLVCLKWHGKGFFLFNLNEPDSDSLMKIHEPGALIDGLAFDKNKIIIISEGGYYLKSFTDIVSDDGTINVEGLKLSGKPTIFNNYLYVSNRMTGKVCSVNIFDPAIPKKVWEHDFKGNPGLVIEVQGRVIVPAGREGLYVFDKRGNPFYSE
ncbi:LVIVD repeat-containing protein [Membranihabitans marinus]|uniref:hypothetical protein n=1 Tax=Membranihabitans marinus TaxID=1227546 RepID=UPI001F2BCE14|nr:hypothetical protein [Membranihabitans marinus]